MLQIIHDRLYSFMRRQIPQEQEGFVKGRDTREQILNLRMLIEKAREYNVRTGCYASLTTRKRLIALNGRNCGRFELKWVRRNTWCG